MANHTHSQKVFSSFQYDFESLLFLCFSQLDQQVLQNIKIFIWWRRLAPSLEGFRAKWIELQKSIFIIKLFCSPLIRGSFLRILHFFLNMSLITEFLYSIYVLSMFFKKVKITFPSLLWFCLYFSIPYILGWSVFLLCHIHIADQYCVLL